MTNYWQSLKRVVNKYWRLIQYSVVGLAFVLIGITLRTYWNDLSSFDWELSYPWFVTSLLLVSIVALSMAVWWTLSIRLLQGQLGWKRGVRIWALSQLAKYLPGGIWNYAGRVVACDRVGVSKGRAALSLAIETVLRIQAAAVVFLVSLPFWPKVQWSRAELVLVVGSLLLGLVALDPHILSKGIDFILRILRRPPANIVPLSYRHLLGLFAGHVLTVAGAGGAFYLMVFSIHPEVPITAALPMAGMLAVSVIAGFLNPLTPHGLGTREGLLILLLRYYLPLPVTIVVALLCRLWLTISELIGILIVAILLRE